MNYTECSDSISDTFNCELNCSLSMALLDCSTLWFVIVINCNSCMHILYAFDSYYIGMLLRLLGRTKCCDNIANKKLQIRNIYITYHCIISFATYCTGCTKLYIVHPDPIRMCVYVYSIHIKNTSCVRSIPSVYIICIYNVAFIVNQVSRSIRVHKQTPERRHNTRVR